MIHRYQAFVSGCDNGAAVAGVSHKIFEMNQVDMGQASGFLSSVVAAVKHGLRVLGGRQIGTLIVIAFQFFGNILARLLMRVPLIGAIGGAFVGFRKIIRPW